MSDSSNTEITPSERAVHVRETWGQLGEEERFYLFTSLPEEERDSLFLTLGSREQADVLLKVPDPATRQSLMRLLAPDDAVDLIQCVDKEIRPSIVGHLDRLMQKEVTVLLAYAEDEAGGLMSTRFARVRPEMTVDETFSYIRRQARRALATMSYTYVLDENQTLLGVISLRELFLAEPSSRIADIMRNDVIAVAENTDQEAITQLLTQNKLVAVPVVDAEQHMRGIITIDDVMDVMEEEATEDIHKMGGTEAVTTQYFETSFLRVVQSRARWLAALFIGEMFTASAMSYYEEKIEKAIILALFIPLIISSGGNSGSQASTLIVRALALGEVRSRNWLRVFGREAAAGLLMGVLLGVLGFFRVYFWPNAEAIYGAHYIMVALTVAVSVVGVVLWGTIAGSMIPLLLNRCGLDPASSSTPFIATLVDVTGIVVYFWVAQTFLTGLLL